MFNKIDEHIQNKSKVISLRYGIGEIVGSFIMYDGIDDYLEIDYLVDEKTRYFCMKHTSDIRLISSKAEIDYALKLMSKRLGDDSIENNFNELNPKFLDKNVLFIVKRIVDLFRKNELSIKDNILLYATIDSLEQEVAEVYKVDTQCAHEIVNDFMKCA